jgi:spore coat polysaccharide biosynthesis protein SpsF (cytidylyltransferase family)
VSAVLREGLASGAGYFGLAGEFPDGFDCEGFTVQAIDLADKIATTNLDREHVTTIMKNETTLFSKREVCLFSGLDNIRLTVDESRDLDFLNLILSRADFRGSFPEAATLLQVVQTLQPHEILNRGIARNAGFVWSLGQES